MTVDLRDADSIDTAIVQDLVKSAVAVIKRRKRLRVLASGSAYPIHVLRITGQIGSISDVGAVRDAVKHPATNAGMHENRVHRSMGCAVEAIANVRKHAGGGGAGMYSASDGLLFVASDSGPGIGALSLRDVASTKGYSTAGTLGMGYEVMLRFAGKVYLATSPTGTTVAIETKVNDRAPASEL